MPEEFVVKRCPEELDEIRVLLDKARRSAILYAQYVHECAIHHRTESCELGTKIAKELDSYEKDLEEAFDNLSRCLGRIAHE